MLYRELVRHLPGVGVLMFDSSYRFLVADGEALREQGWQKEMLEGRTLHEVFPPEQVARLQPFYDAALTGRREIQSYASRTRQYELVTVPLEPDETGPRGMLVIRDVTQHKDAARLQEDQLQAVQLLMQQARDEMEQFIRHASHDLQAPLRQISNFVELLALDHGAQLDADGLDLLTHLQGSTQRLRRLLQDLLALARSGSTVTIPEPVDMGIVAQELLADLDLGGARVSVGPLPIILGSPVLLHLLLQNLLENALRYRSPARPLEVSIGSRWWTQGWEISVTDNGLGIAEADQTRIFQPFVRAHAGGGGSGLGLAACERIARRHGGHITVESAPDVGSTFRVFLAGNP